MTARNAEVEQKDAPIQTGQLIDRLEQYILGEVELSAAQVRSIAILLKKSVPDVQSVALKAETGPGAIAEVIFKGLNG